MGNRVNDFEKMLKKGVQDAGVTEFEFIKLKKHRAIDFICKDGRKRRVVYSETCSDSKRGQLECKQDLRLQLRRGGNIA